MPLIFILLFFIFSLAEYEQLNPNMNKYFQSLVFSTTSILAIFTPVFRRKLFYLAFLLLLMMVAFYLTGQLLWSNALASLGIGILLILSLSYVPEIIKKGYVEKL